MKTKRNPAKMRSTPVLQRCSLIRAHTIN
jgi:hypothetical protein